MEKRETPVAGAYIVIPDDHVDERGSFRETFSYRNLSALGIGGRIFVQGNESHSRRLVLRGMHYQLRQPQAKLCWLSRGEAVDVVADIREGSPTFGAVALVHLTATGPDAVQVFVPRGCAHGFLSLADGTAFHYACDDYYAPADGYGIRWDDPQLAIPWKTLSPVLSEKDAALPTLAEARTSGLLPRWEPPA